MSWTTQQKIRLGFWLLTLVPLVLGLVAIKNATALAASALDVADTTRLMRDLESLLSMLKDVEVAQREYILTGDESRVDELNKLRTSILESLNKLPPPRPGDMWMEHLQTVVPDKFEEINKTIERRRNEGFEAALKETISRESTMNELRVILRNLISNEERLLRERQDKQKSEFVATMSLFGVVLLLNVGLIWLVAFVTRRESERIRALNEELEHRVALRTEALQRSNEDLQQFAYVVSHDLKEPLRMIASYSTLLQRRYQGRLDGDADVYINFVVDGVKRMDTMIQGLLDYSRVGETASEDLVIVNSENAVQSAIDNLKVRIAEAGAQIKYDKLPLVTYDATRLTQVFQNLIGNAVKYRGDKRPVVEISAERSDIETIFSIRDNGIGIESEHLDKIFGIFERLHRKDYEGTGIGLAAVKKIVEREGGRIWVESTPGSGSTFHFSVPHRAPTLQAKTQAG